MKTTYLNLCIVEVKEQGWLLVETMLLIRICLYSSSLCWTWNGSNETFDWCIFVKGNREIKMGWMGWWWHHKLNHVGEFMVDFCINSLVEFWYLVVGNGMVARFLTLSCWPWCFIYYFRYIGFYLSRLLFLGYSRS